MKIIKALGYIFLLTLISPMIAIPLAGTMGEATIFGVAGIVRYSWIVFFFIPIGILSIIIGLILKKYKQNYKKNIIIAFICIPFLIIFGLFRFAFNSFSYDLDKVSLIENKTNLELPDEIKVATNKLDLYEISTVKIINNESKEAFEQEIKNNQLWEKELSFEIKSLLPLDIQDVFETYDYFVFYNITSDEYNKNSVNGECDIIFIAYNCDLQRLIILDDYKINLN